jgi:hypothetical protein
MSSLDTRAQLLGRSLQPRVIPYPPTTNSNPANLKCLYGPNVEVLTLCVDAAHDQHQAVAMSFNPFNGTWTKFLHGEPASTTSSAIQSLLGESNKELTSIFSTNGITVPFQGNMMQTLTLCRGERRDSGAGSSEPSEFVFVATPGSSLSDNFPVEHGNDELPPAAAEAPVEEVAEEPDNYELLVEEAPPPVEEVAEPGDNELLVEEAPAEEATVAPANEDIVAEESIPVLEEPAPPCMDPEPVPPECEATNLDWGTWFSSKKDKKKKTRFMFDESCPPAEEPSSQEVYLFDCPVEKVKEPEPEPDTSYPQEERKADEVCSSDYVAEEVIDPEPKPDTSYPQEELNADEAGSSDCVAEEVKAPEPEPDARPSDNDFGWGSFSSKKDKKKKGKISVETEELKVEEIVPPSSESNQVVEDDTWGDWGALPSKKSKKKKKVKDASVELAPEPVVEDDSWGGWGAISKKSKKKKDEVKDASVELAPKPAVDDDWWKFATRKDEAKNPVPEPQLEVKDEEPSIAKEPCDHTLEAPLDPEAIEHPATAPSLPGIAYTKTIAHASRQEVTRSGQTVVFTIQYPDEINIKPLQAMITLAGNTRGAIFDAVNSYLDSKTVVTGKQGQRKLEIKYGVGKNGDVDLSALEETMWPEYLEYFRQYTRLPELTVDVVDC